MARPCCDCGTSRASSYGAVSENHKSTAADIQFVPISHAEEDVAISKAQTTACGH